MTTNSSTANDRIIQTEWGPLPLREAAKRAGVHLGTIHSRMERGWPDEKLLLPLKRQKAPRRPSEDHMRIPPLQTVYKQTVRDQQTILLAMKELRRMSLVLNQKRLRLEKAIQTRAEAKTEKVEKRRVAALPKKCEAEALSGKCGEPVAFVGQHSGFGYCGPHAHLAEKYDGETLLPI